jgi:hypothetical protein
MPCQLNAADTQSELIALNENANSKTKQICKNVTTISIIKEFPPNFSPNE